MTGVTVRAARPQDVGFLARIMYESMLPGTGRGIFDLPLVGTGIDPVAFHEALLRTGTSNWGQLDRYLVLEDTSGRLVGGASAFLASEPDRRPLTAAGFEIVAADLGWSPDMSRLFWRAYVSIFGLFGRAPQLDHPGDYVIEYAAIAPEFRGRGLYATLLEAHVRRARTQGFASVAHTAIMGNDAVLRALTKFGFREHVRFGPEYYRGFFPGLIRLVHDV